MNLSEHFTIEEATHSDKAKELGINNSFFPNSVMTVASKTAMQMEKVRNILGHPIGINSWLRCPKLNAALGSKSTSKHLLGEAVDFVCPEFGTPAQICIELLKHKAILGWDQLILEHTWVHISWNSVPNAVQRGQVLSLLSSGTYAIGLTDKNGKFINLGVSHG